MKDEEIFALIILRQKAKMHPGKNDILCGKDRKCLNHPGSIFYKQKIDEYAVEYLDYADSRSQKMAIVNRCLEYFLLEEGRDFFKIRTTNPRAHYNTQWEIVDIRGVRDKVGHAIRFTAQKIKKRREREESTARATSRFVGITNSGTRTSTSAHYISDGTSSSSGSSRDGLDSPVCVSQELTASFLEELRGRLPAQKVESGGEPKEVIQFPTVPIGINKQQQQQLEDLDLELYWDGDLSWPSQTLSQPPPPPQLLVQENDDSALLRYIDNYQLGQSW